MLFLNNPLLTSDNIIAAFENLVIHEKPITPPSYIVHAMNSLPDNLKKYKNNYIWIDPKLYYVKSDGQQENSDLIIPESLNNYLRTTFKNTKTKTSKLTPLTIDQLVAINPSHKPQALVTPPSELEQFQKKLKAIFFDDVNTVDSLETDPRFQSDFHRLKHVLAAIFALDKQSNKHEALKQLKQSNLIDWNNPAANTQFESLDHSYGYFAHLSEDEKKVLETVFSKLALACQAMIVLFEKTNDANGTLAYHYAYSLMALLLDPAGIKDDQQTFDEISRATHKLFESYQSKSNQPLHDLLLVQLQLPHAQEIVDRQGWLQFIKSVGTASIDYLSWAQKIEHKIAEQPNETGLRAPRTINEAKEISKLLTYTRAGEDPDFAELCRRYKVSESRFNHCLNYMGLKSSEWPKKNSDTLPDVMIKGTDDAAGFYYVKLPLTDKRALILGDITMCCQSMGGQSEGCVKDGASLENNGFYVLMRQHSRTEKSNLFINGEINDNDFDIVGQGYLWKSLSGNLCFDSIECLSSVPVPVIKQMLSSFAGHVLTNNRDIKRVNVGTGGKTPPNLFGLSQITEQVIPGTMNYGDANRQYSVAKTPYISLSTEKVNSSLWGYSSDFKACVEYLLNYVDDPSEFIEQIKHIKSISKRLNPASLMTLLSIEKRPKITDLEPVNFDELKGLNIEQRCETLKNISTARLIWDLGNLTEQSAAISWEKYEKMMTIAANRIADVIPYIPEDKLETISKTLRLFDEKIRFLQYLSTSQKREIYELFKKILPTTIQNAHDLYGVLAELRPEECAEICLAIKHKLPKILIEAGPATTNHRNNLNSLSHEQWKAIKRILPLPDPNDICSAYDFNTVLYYYREKTQQDAIYELMKEKLPAFVLETPYLLRKFSFEQCEAIVDVIYNKLMLEPKLHPELLCFLDYFTQRQATKVCDMLVDCLSLADIIAHFDVLLQNISPTRRELFLQAQMESLPNFIKSVNDFQQILSSLPLEMRTLFFERMQDKLSQLQSLDFGNFEKTMQLLTPEQQMVFYSAHSYKIPKYIATLKATKAGKLYVISDMLMNSPPDICAKLCRSILNELHEIIQSEQDFVDFIKKFPVGGKAEAIYEILKETFTPLISTAKEFEYLGEKLSPQQYMELYHKLKHKIPNLKQPLILASINDLKLASQLHDFFERLSIEERVAEYEQSKMHLVSLVKSMYDVSSILSNLSLKQQVDFLHIIKNQLPHLVKSVSDIYTLASYFTPSLIIEEQKKLLMKQESWLLIYNTIKDRLPRIIKTPHDLSRTLLIFPLYNVETLKIMQRNIPSMVKKTNDVHDMLENIPDGTRIELYGMIKNKLPGLINNIQDVYYVLARMPSAQREEILAVIKPKMHQIIHEINESKWLATGYLTPDRMLCYLQDAKKILPIEYQQEIDNTLELHTLRRHLALISSTSKGKEFTTSLLRNDDHDLKIAFNDLIESIFKKRYMPRIFGHQITRDQFISELSTLEINWLQKINSSLELGLDSTQLTSLNEIKNALNSYMNAHSGHAKTPYSHG